MPKGLITHGFWLAAAASTSIGILILQYLNGILTTRGSRSHIP
jgi:hypothetical protein